MSIAQSLYVGYLALGVIAIVSSMLYGKYSKSAYAKIVRAVQLYTAGTLYLKYGRVAHAMVGTSILMIWVYVPLLMGWNVAAVFTLVTSGSMFAYQLYMVAKVSKNRRVLASVRDLSIFA